MHNVPQTVQYFSFSQNQSTSSIYYVLKIVFVVTIWLYYVRS